MNGNTYTEIYPATFKTYYENIDRAEIPFPRDLHMVAGNASAKSQSDINEKVTAITWWCDTGADDRNSRPRAAFPRGTCSAHMQAILRFPDCVNPAKVTEYAYAAASPGGKCPSGMKRMPSLRFSVRYNTRAAIPGGWSGVPPFKLACGEVSITLQIACTCSLYTNASHRLVKDTVSTEISSMVGTKMLPRICSRPRDKLSWPLMGLMVKAKSLSIKIASQKIGTQRVEPVIITRAWR